MTSARGRASGWIGVLSLMCALALVTMARSATFAAATGEYATAVLADAPVGYWRLGEANGTTAANAAGGSDGLYIGGVTLGLPGALGTDPDTSVGLDGSNDTVRIASSAALNPTGALTLEAWIKPAAITSEGMTLARKTNQYELTVSSSGRLILGLWKGSTKSTVTSPTGAIPPGEWSHVVGSWNGTTASVYINGFLRGTASISGPISSGTSLFYIGTSGGSSNPYPGQIDEVAVYATGLPISRVQAHMEAVGDISGPTVSLLSPGPGSVMDATPNFGGHAGTALGDLPNVTVDVYSGPAPSGSPVATLVTPRHEGGSYSVVAPPLAAGTYTARATQLDASGNTGTSAASTFTVDTSSDPYLIAAGDIAACDSTGDEATSALLDRLPGVVAAAGDTVYDSGTPAEYTNCYDPTWGRHKARTRPAVGDHEYETPGAAGYYAYFGAVAGDPAKGYYSYDIAGWHVIVMNANCTEIGGCDVGSPEEQWVRADLAANPRLCTLAVIDKPRFSSGSIHGSRTSMIPFWQPLYDAGVEFVLSGDDHDYERFAPQRPDGTLDTAQGVRQFVVGTGGSWHYALAKKLETNSEVAHSGTFGVMKLTLHPSGYEWSFIPVAGQTFTDSGSTACHGIPGSTDTTPPTVTLTQPANGSSGTITTPLFRGAAGTAAGDLATVTVNVYAGTTVSGSPQQTLTATAAAGAWQVTANPALSPGTYTAQATQQDQAANTGTSNANTFTITPPAAGYRATVLSDSPAGYWRLGESSGTQAANEVSGAPAGTYAGTVNLGLQGALAGDQNTAAALNGTNGQITIPSYTGLEPGTGGLTLELWVKRSQTKRDEVLLSKGGGAYELAFSKPDFIELRVASSDRIAVSTGKISDTTTWHHLAVTINGSSVAIYLDGVNVTGKVTLRALQASGAPLRIGSNGSSFFAGAVDEVAVYATALSSSRVQAHFAAGR